MRLRSIIIYSVFLHGLLLFGAFVHAQDSSTSLSNLQTVSVDSINIKASVSLGSDRPPGEFTFRPLDAFWVWRKAHQYSEVGTPAVRVVFSDGLDQRLLLDSVIEEQDVMLVSRKQRKITVDLLGSSARLKVRVASQGSVYTFELQFQLDLEVPQLVRGSTCENYGVDLIRREGPSGFPFLGVDCLEEENAIAVGIVRPGGTSWVASSDADRLNRVFRRTVKKSGFLGNDLHLRLVLPDGKAASFHLRVSEKKPANSPIFVPTFGGQLAARSFSGSRQLDDRRWLEGIKGDFRQENQIWNLRTYVEARALFEEFADLSERYFDLREGYLEWSPFGAVRLRVGKQLASWGRADEINPTDVFTPRRTGLLLVDASSEQKTGALLGELRWNSDWLGTFTAVGNPYLVPSDIYATGDRLQRTRPSRRSQWGGGFRWDRQWDLIETGLSFYNGVDPAGNLGLGQNYSVTQEFRRTAMLGLDGVLAADRFALRFEVARTWPLGRDYRIGEKRSEFFGVGGFERQWDDGSGGVITQIIAKKIFHLDQGTYAGSLFEAVETNSRRYHLQNEEYMLAFSARIARSFWNDRIEAEVFGLKEWTTDNYFLRPKIRYSPWDHWKIQVGYEYYGGTEVGIFSFVRRNELAFFEISRFF